MTKTEFNQDQFESIYPAGIERHYWTLARNKIIAKELEKHRLQGKRILEIGCGRGIVVEFLRKNGFDCLGAELAPVTVPQNLASYIYSGIDAIDLKEELRNSIDVVLLFDVIEHLADPEQFLHTIKNSFPNVSTLIVTVPARSELWSNYDTFNGHFRRYSTKMLAVSLQEGGWKVKSTQYLFHALYLPARLLLKLVGQRETVITAPRGIMSAVHFMLANLFVADWALLPKGLFGTSVLAVAERV